jgi:hypothetical protein
MFTANIQDIKIRQAELHRQAAEYRLAQSLKRSNPWITNVFSMAGKLLIVSGQQLVNRYQPAN